MAVIDEPRVSLKPTPGALNDSGGRRVVWCTRPDARAPQPCLELRQRACAALSYLGGGGIDPLAPQQGGSHPQPTALRKVHVIPFAVKPSKQIVFFGHGLSVAR